MEQNEILCVVSFAKKRMKKKVEVSFVNVMETAKSGSEPRTSGNSHHRNVCVYVCVCV